MTIESKPAQPETHAPAVNSNAIGMLIYNIALFACPRYASLFLPKITPVVTNREFIAGRPMVTKSKK